MPTRFHLTHGADPMLTVRFGLPVGRRGLASPDTKKPLAYSTEGFLPAYASF